jgi:hypothetical protein
MSAQGFLIAGDKNSNYYMRNMRKKEEGGIPLKLKHYGVKLSIHKLRLERHIWSTKTLAIVNQTNKTSEPSKALIYAQKS